MKTKLKWRKVNEYDWVAGPFEVHVYKFTRQAVAYMGDFGNRRAYKSVDDAKSACEALASKIIRAVKKGGKSQ